MTPLDRIHALAALLWPDVDVELIVRVDSDWWGAGLFPADADAGAEYLRRHVAATPDAAVAGLDADLAAHARTLGAALLAAAGVAP